MKKTADNRPAGRRRVRRGRLQGHQQDQDRRHRRLGLRRSWTRPAAACTFRTAPRWKWWIPMPAKWSAQIDAIARRPRDRHRARSEQGLHHQRPVQQRHDLRSEDAGEDGRAGHRQESRRDLLRAEDQARLHLQRHSGNDSTAIDAKTNEIVGTFPLGPQPEFCVVDGTGKLYVNLEDTSEVLEIDAAKPAVTRRAVARPLRRPVGPGHRCEEQEAVLGVRQTR